MKPDIIKNPYEIQAIDGYVGVFCKCGNVLHVKNIPERAGEFIKIECPCGFEIETVYTKR